MMQDKLLDKIVINGPATPQPDGLQTDFTSGLDMGKSTREVDKPTGTVEDFQQNMC